MPEGAPRAAFFGVLLHLAHHHERDLHYGPARFGAACGRPVIAFAREDCFMPFPGSGDRDAARLARDQSTDLRARLRRRSARRQRLILLGLATGLVAAVLVGVAHVAWPDHLPLDARRAAPVGKRA
jgi:hypothetical protein